MGIHDKDRIAEEPCNAKVLRTVCAVRRVVISPVQLGLT
jgi:hypothetical protein